MKIVIPTHNRPGKVVTTSLFDDPTDYLLCVEEGQVEAYRKNYPGCEYLVHSNALKGLTPKRQWICDTVGDVFMMDDDVDMVIDMGASPGEPNKVRGDRLVSIIDRHHTTAADLGVKLYGFPVAGNPMAYSPMHPFRFNIIVQEHAFGMVRGDSKLWFHPGIVGTNADWLTCLNMHHHRIGLFDMRYGFNHTGTFTAPGGMQGIRTRRTRESDVDVMEDAFGSDIVKRREMTDDMTDFAGWLGFRMKLPW